MNQYKLSNETPVQRNDRIARGVFAIIFALTGAVMLGIVIGILF